MIFYPLYSESQRRIFKFVFFGAIVGMALGAIVISYLYPNSKGIGQQLFQFCCMLIGFYVAFSYFNFHTLVVEKEKKEFHICKTLFGKILQKRTFRIKDAKEVIIGPTPINTVYDITLKGKGYELFLAKGEQEFIDELGTGLIRDLGVTLKKRS